MVPHSPTLKFLLPSIQEIIFTAPTLLKMMIGPKNMSGYFVMKNWLLPAHSRGSLRINNFSACMLTQTPLTHTTSGRSVLRQERVIQKMICIVTGNYGKNAAMRQNLMVRD